MPIKYISADSKISASEASDRVMDENDKECSPIEPPWVIVGNVVASVSITGDTSWRHIVNDLIQRGQQDFLILCGRHGDLAGNVVGNDGLYPARASNDTATDPAGDRDTARSLAQPGVTIEVRDVNDAASRSLAGLQSLIRDGISNQKVVVLAWCFSLHAMKSSLDVDNIDMARATANYHAKIKDTSEIDWSYLESFPQLPAVRTAVASATVLN